MLAEVISIGDELTSGQRLDTNSQWLSERLGELGVRVVYHTTVADDLEANVHVFRAAIERADIVVASGGLGPTADDLTRDAIAAATDRQLALDPAALEHIERLFARRQRPMPERNRVQAMFPAGSRVIANPEGTAPGIDLTVPRLCTPYAPQADSPASDSCRVFALPGVPAEMKGMWSDTVAPAIREMFPSPRIIYYRRIKCFGVGESDLEAMLPDLIRRGREPQVGITVSGATITLRIAATGESREACLAAIEPTVATIHECLGDLVFGEEDDELQDAVIRFLAAKGKTLATAEWGTGGLISDWLSSASFRLPSPYLGGFVLASPESRRELLESAGRTLALDAPMESVVSALAVACRLRLGADYALAVGDLPIHDSTATAPPHFRYAVATPDGIRARSSPYAGPADILKLRAAKQALNLLRLELLHA
ncbi:MAG TPA: CinA family nicotinamide mononucleotide deamidase-related protein [Pirellulales bacterium]|nr:CinA family nicotinamide mononucleotide deamidase-related protein [Pirellulales bacterium]